MPLASPDQIVEALGRSGGSGGFPDDARRRSVLILIWLTLAALIPFGIVVFYGVEVFSDVPFADDWLFIDRVLAFEDGTVGLAAYLFERHNGHPCLPTRLAFLASYYLSDLNLTPVRWATLTIHMAIAAMSATLLLLSLRDSSGPSENTSLLESHAAILGLPLLVLLPTSLAGAESYAHAANVGNALASFFAIGAVLSCHLWHNTRGRPWFVVSLACATLATFSMAHGSLTWGALAFMAFAQPRRSDRLAGMALTAACVAFIVFNALWFSANAAARELNSLKMMVSAVMLFGLPWLSPMDNDMVVAHAVAAGMMVLCAAAFSVYWWIRAPEQTRVQGVPFVALLGLGCGVIALIAVGRHTLPLKHIGSSRYVDVVFPTAAGLIGLAGLAARTNTPSRMMLAGLFAIGLLGWITASGVELTLAPQRAVTMRAMRDVLTSGKPLDTQTIERQLYVGGWYAAFLIPRTAESMRERKIGVFSER